MIVILETARLVLREFVPEDLDDFERVIGDPIAMRHYPSPFDRAGVEQWIARNRERYQRDGVGLWAMVMKPYSEHDGSRGEVVGDCGILVQQVEGEKLYEIGYHLRRDLWGKGLATEAAVACRDWGFQHLNTDRLISLVRPENVSSSRVAERNGMTVWKTVEWRGLTHHVYCVSRESDGTG